MMFQSLIKFKLKSKVVFIVRYNHLPPNHKKKEKEDDSHCKMFCHSLGWQLFLGNDRSFTRTNGTIKNDPERSHHFEKKNERIQRVLKNIGTICKGTVRKLLEKNV